MPRGRPPKNRENKVNLDYDNNPKNEDDLEDDLEFESTDEADQLLDFEALEEDQESNRPLVTSPLWHDYVMSQFSDEELLKEKNDRNEYTGKVYPSVFGLRRVAELLIGELVQNNSRFIQLTDNFAIAECELIFRSSDHDEYRFVDVGNCHTNTPEPFDVHLPSIAATRAEGRALRKALRIRTVCAEEMQGAKKGNRIVEEVGSTNLENLNNENNPINSAQIAAVKTMALREKLNVERLVEFKHAGMQLENLTTAQGRELLAFIHQVVAKKESVPDSVREQ